MTHKDLNASIKKLIKSKTKLVFFTGGVVSSLGKGIAAASLGVLLKARGFKVTIMKLDPYINVDPGTMNPYQHGEVYVTDDGAETDLDLGHYERFLDQSMSKCNNATAGQIYETVIQRERAGDYLGGTIQVIPHITDEIKRRIADVAIQDWDIVLVEVGGTVGDIEGLPFLEAIRQLGLELGANRRIYVHLTLIPFLSSAGEIKTKPTQHSVKELREIGIQPDIIVCRTNLSLSKSIKQKIGLFCSVSTDHVIEAIDIKDIYEAPLNLDNQKFSELVTKKFNLKGSKQDLTAWKSTLVKKANIKRTTRIVVCGKYTEVPDAYKSIKEAFDHAAVFNDVNVKVDLIDSEIVDRSNIAQILENSGGLLVPGGFGDRGIEGKIAAIKFARENDIPFFGICLGMQCAIIEYARNVLDLKNANSTEFNLKTKYPVIDLLPEQRHLTAKGATMRLGGQPCHIQPGTLAFSIYGQELINERHRHRYEFNNDFMEIFTKNGMVFGGFQPYNSLVEMIEIPSHKWFVGCQFHPELKSRFTKPHPLFREFVAASVSVNCINE